MDRFTPTIMPEYVLGALQFPLHMGLTLEDISRLSDVDLSDIDNRLESFSLNEVMRLIQACNDTLKIPHYGLANGNHMPINCHGMAGVSFMYQNSYADCLKSICRLSSHLFPPLSMDYFETNNTVGFRIYEVLSLAPYPHFFLEWIMVISKNLLHFLLGSESKPKYISFPYPKPDYADEYHQHLGCELLFDTEYAEYVVDIELAQRKMSLSNNSIANRAETRFLEITIGEEDDILNRARTFLAKHIDTKLTLDQVAEQLKMNSRTLRRQLQKQGTSYLGIMNELRREAAISQLTYSTKSITDIAVNLSFYDTASFSKAFKRWTGRTPREFRSTFFCANAAHQE